MNYLTEILEFNNWLEYNPIGASAISLWYALMYISNKSGWQEWFTVPVAALELKAGLGRRDVYRARNRLQQAGRIEVKERNGNQCSMYRLMPFGTQVGTQVVTQSAHNQHTKCHTSGTQSVTQAAPLYKYKQNINKTIPPKSPNGDFKEGKAKRNVIPPSVQDVEAYCMERNNGIDAEEFVDFYASKGWKVGKEPMKDWEACVRTWERQREQRKKQSTPSQFRSVENIDTFKPKNILL